MVDKIAVAEREARALALRRDGHTYAEIGQVLGVNRQMATRIVQRGLARVVREPAEQVRAIELLALDHLQVQALAVLHRRHFFVQGGEVVKRANPETGEEEELADDGPVLAAIGCVLRVQERRAKLRGLDAPTRLDVNLALAWERASEEEQLALLGNVGTDLFDKHLRQLQAELDERDELDRLREELASRGPATPPAAETIATASEPDEELLGEAVLAGLAAAGVDVDQVDVDRLGDAIEMYLTRRRGGDS
jgi:hypothetical protein